MLQITLELLEIQAFNKITYSIILFKRIQIKKKRFLLKNFPFFNNFTIRGNSHGQIQEFQINMTSCE